MAAMKKILRVVLSRTFAFVILVLLQIGIAVFIFNYLAQLGSFAYTAITLISVLVLVTMMERDTLNPSYKLMWLLILVMIPATGTLLYLLWGHRDVPDRQKGYMLEAESSARMALHQQPQVMEELKKANRAAYQSAIYLLRYAQAPVYSGTQVEYYAGGEQFFPPFLEALKNAEKFIFLEYFIIDEGYMWNTTLEVLQQKAAEGVDVRIIYDGIGSLFTLPHSYPKKLRAMGIKCEVFSPITVTMHISQYAMLNHRDHRKIAVVDGNVAFSGGLNLADEYINAVTRYGEWKDSAFRLTGDAAYGLTVSFLKMWNTLAKTGEDYQSYRPVPAALPPGGQMWEKGMVQPYTDSPLDTESVAENAYLNIINNAHEYVYIVTPYLILDHEMISCLSLAAKKGVDVRILTPKIPDKPTVFLVTQSYYKVLLEAGVRIFEFTPGFAHAKMYAADDKQAIIGSANMDYRSLYLHFENCTSFYGGPVVHEVKEDILACIARGEEVTLEKVHSMPLHRRFLQIIARFFAPML